MNIIPLMQAIGLKSNEEGVCYGLAAMAARAHLQGPKEFEKHENRIRYIQLLSEDSTDINQIEAILNLTHAQYLKDHPEESKDTEKHQKLRDVAAFLSSVDIYQHENEYRYLFPEGTLKKQSLKAAAELLAPKVNAQSNNPNPLTVANVFVNQYNNSSLKNFLEEYIKKMKYNGSYPPLMLNTGEHAISICYSTSKKKWIMTDHDQMEYIDRTEDMVRLINTSLATFNNYELEEVLKDLQDLIRNCEKHSLKPNEIKGWYSVFQPLTSLEKQEESTEIKSALNNILEKLMELVKPQDLDTRRVKTLYNDINNIVNSYINRPPIIATYVCVNKANQDKVKEPIKNWRKELYSSKSKKESKTDHTGHSELSLALIHGDIDKVESIITTNPDVINKLNVIGISPLYYAAEHNHLEICKLLIEKKAEVNLSNASNYTALEVAAESNGYKTVEYLIEKKADVNKRSSDYNYTPLNWAITNNNLKIADYLIEKNASLDIEILEDMEVFAKLKEITESKFKVNLENLQDIETFKGLKQIVNGEFKVNPENPKDIEKLKKLQKIIKTNFEVNLRTPQDKEAIKKLRGIIYFTTQHTGSQPHIEDLVTATLRQKILQEGKEEYDNNLKSLKTSIGKIPFKLKL